MPLLSSLVMKPAFLWNGRNIFRNVGFVNRLNDTHSEIDLDVAANKECHLMSSTPKVGRDFFRSRYGTNTFDGVCVAIFEPINSS